ncbi:Crp/Fnr family transcriptional regulator [Glaciimonas soli]|nr:Crp/Fnr family transcriptional regulator [Glaciimonas soli]
MSVVQLESHDAENIENVDNFLDKTESKRASAYVEEIHPRNWRRILAESLRKNFPGWPDATLEVLCAAARMQSHFDSTLIYAKGEIGASLLLVISGSLELSIGNVEGKRVVMNYIPPMEISNIVPVMDGAPIAHDYRTHGKTVLAYIPKTIFLQQLVNSPQLMSSVVTMLCQRNRQLQDYASYLSLASFRSKLAARLLYLGGKYGRTRQDGQNGIDIDIKLSQENLASLLVASRQSIGKELRWLAEKNIVAIEYNKVTIFDWQALERLSAV